MNIKEIKDMIKLMEENGLAELEIEKDGQRIKLRKESKGEIVTRIESLAAPAAKEEIPKIPKETQKKYIEVKAPMVGTFYTAPAPDAAPFVDVGSEIEVGHVLCIIEAMKLMNELKSEVKGKIAEILVDNAEPIEFGQVLFLIDPK